MVLTKYRTAAIWLLAGAALLAIGIALHNVYELKNIFTLLCLAGGFIAIVVSAISWLGLSNKLPGKKTNQKTLLNKMRNRGKQV